MGQGKLAPRVSASVLHSHARGFPERPRRERFPINRYNLEVRLFSRRPGTNAQRTIRIRKGGDKIQFHRGISKAIKLEQTKYLIR
jgi:hypothetical protein